MWEAILGKGIGRLLENLNFRRLKRHIQARDLPPAAGTHFTILITDLAGDEDGKQTRHVAEALEGQPGLQVRQFGRVLAAKDHGDLAGNLAAAARQGRRWLEQQNADILIWGEVAKADQVLRLRFLSRAVEGDDAAKGYVFDEALELPPEFGVDFGQVLYMTALSAVGPATEMQGQYLVKLLRPAAQKVGRLLENPPRGLLPGALAHVHVGIFILLTIVVRHFA